MGHDYKDPKVREAFDYIVDTMTCADGGIAFSHFMFFVRRMDELASQGDEPAKKLLEIMFSFHRLIKVVTK